MLSHQHELPFIKDDAVVSSAAQQIQLRATLTSF